MSSDYFLNYLRTIHSRPFTDVLMTNIMSSVESERELGSDTAAQAPEQLSGVAVVIIIAVGVQTFIMLFIFAKRQIMRFTLRSRRGPHVSVGQGGVKVS